MLSTAGRCEGERVGLNKDIAAQLAEARLAEWQRDGHDEWRAMIDDKDLRRIVGEDGKRYTVVSHAFDDGVVGSGCRSRWAMAACRRWFRW